MRKVLFAAVVLAVLCVDGVVWANVPVSIVGQLGGSYNGAAVSGDTAFVGYGARVLALDITDPSAPVVLGQTALLPDVVRDIRIRGGLAYVAAGDLVVVDISNPAAMSTVGRCGTVTVQNGNAPRGAWSLEISGGYAYIANLYNSLAVIDISDPTHPAMASECYCSCAEDVAISGNHAYVADWWGGVRIIDITNPLNPTQVGFYDEYYASGVEAVGGYVYAVYGSDGVKILDVTDPTDPVHVGDISSVYYPESIVVSGNYACLVGVYGDLAMLDIADPASPVEVGSSYTSGYPQSIAVNSGKLYIAESNVGLSIFDISDPTNPQGMGTYQGDAMVPNCFNTSGNLTFVGSYDGFRTYDGSDPRSLQLLGSMPSLRSMDIAISGDHVYSASGSSLEIVDVSNASEPRLEGSYRSQGYYPQDVTVSDGHAYLTGWYDETGWSGGFKVISVADTENPLEVGNVDANGLARTMAISGNYAYIADSYRGLSVASIADPTNPSILSTTPTYYPNDVVIAGNCAYLADSNRGLTVFDVSIPAAPVPVAQLDLPGEGNAYAIALSGTVAYIADGPEGLQVVDVSIPSQPTVVGTIAVPGGAWGIAISGNTVYVNGVDAGLIVLSTGPLPRLSVADAKLRPNGRSTSLTEMCVSAAWKDSFYIESDDRSSGIRVEKPGHGLSVGQRANIVGVMHTNGDGERYIQASSAIESGSGEIEPIGMSNRLVGGIDWRYDSGTGAGQKGIYGGYGLNNIGLLVSIWGRVTASGTYPRSGVTWLYLDDGSHVQDTTGTVGVYCETDSGTSPPAVGTYVRATGISGCELYAGKLVNVLRIRDQLNTITTGPKTARATINMESSLDTRPRKISKM